MKVHSQVVNFQSAEYAISFQLKENIIDFRLMNFNIENKWYFHCMICLYFLRVTVILDLCFNFGIFSEATHLDTQLQLE